MASWGRATRVQPVPHAQGQSTARRPPSVRFIDPRPSPVAECAVCPSSSSTRTVTSASRPTVDDPPPAATCASAASDSAGTRRRASTRRGSRTGASPTAGWSVSATPARPSSTWDAAAATPTATRPLRPARAARGARRGRIDVAVLYPGLALSLPAIHDPELAVASCRVYNDWIAEFCAADRRRWSVSLPCPCRTRRPPSARYVRAVRELGLRGVFCRPNPLNGSLRQLHDEAHEPVWTALEELDVPLTFPRGLWDMPGTSRSMAGLMAPGTHHAVILFFDNYMTLANLVYAGVLERHPRLRLGVLECGGGWIAHWMDRLDEFVESYGWQLSHLRLKPSEYLRRQAGSPSTPASTPWARSPASSQ